MSKCVINRLTISDEYLNKYKSVIESYNEVVLSDIMNIIFEYLFPSISYTLNWMKKDYQIVYNEDEYPVLIDFNKIIPLPPLEGAKHFWGTPTIVKYCYSLRDHDNMIGFTTVWSPPIPIIQQLSRLFRPLIFQMHFIDTDTSSCVEYIECGGGKVKKREKYEWASIEAQHIIDIWNEERAAVRAERENNKL